MSAYTSAAVHCDGRDPSELSPTGMRGCAAVVGGGERPDGSWAFPRTKAEARKEARARGWTTVRSSLGAAFAKDFCPDHKPQEAP